MLFENGKKLWVRFRYEILPNICYWYGRLDHGDKECKMWIESKGILTANQKQFDQSLRAPSYRSYNKPIVFVPSYYDRASVFVKKSTTSDKGSNSSMAEENLQQSLSKSNLDMEWNSKGGVEYTEFPTT